MFVPILASSEYQNWRTPPRILNPMMLLFGGPCDLDPADSEQGNHARRTFDPGVNGLYQSWQCSSLYLNPPFSEVLPWTRKFVSEYRAGRIGEAILCVKLAPDTGWFGLLLALNPTMCLVKGRLKYEKPGIVNSATFPSVCLYFGPRVEEFAAIFGAEGAICRLVQKS